MAVTNVAVRLGVEGSAEVKRTFSETGQAGQEGMAQIVSATEKVVTALDHLPTVAERATNAVRQSAGARILALTSEREAVERLTKAMTDATPRQLSGWGKQVGMAEQAQTAAVHQANFNQVLGVTSAPSGAARDSAAAIDAEMKAMEAVEARVVRLRAEIDPLSVAQQKLALATANATDLLKRGAITEAEHATATRLAKNAFSEAEHAINKHGEAVGLNRMQLMELTHVARSSFDAIAAGANPMRVLAMEGGRLSQALTSGQGGLAGGLGAVSAGLEGVTGLSLGALGGVVAIGGAFLAAGASALTFEASQEKTQRTLDYLGRTSGATVEQVNKIAEAASKAGQATEGEARKMELALAKTGTVGVQSFAGIIAVQRDYAAATGQSMSAAGEALVKMFSDPVAGAKELNSAFHSLSDAEQQHIRDMVAAGDEERAASDLMRQVGKATHGAADELTWYGKALRAAGDDLASFWDNTQKVTASLAHINAAGREGKLSALQTQQSALQTYTQGIGRFDPIALARLAAMPAEIAKVQADIGRATRAVEDAAVSKTSALAGTALRALNPDIDARRQLKTQLEAVQKEAAIGWKGLAPEEVAAGKRDLQALTQAYNTYIPAHEKEQKLAQLDVQIAQTKSPARKAELALERERVSMSGQIRTASEVEALAVAKGEVARAHAAKGSDKHAEALAREAAAMEVNARGALSLADAYLQDDGAAIVAEARRKASTDATKKGIDIEAQMRRQLNLTLSEGAAAAAKDIASSRDQTAGQEAVNAMVRDGTIIADDGAVKLAELTALRPLETAAAVAQAEGLDKLAASYSNLTAQKAKAIADARAANDTAGYNAYLLETARDRRKSGVELQYAGDTSGERERQLAMIAADAKATTSFHMAEDDPRRAGMLDTEVEKAATARAISTKTYLENTTEAQNDNLRLSQAEVAMVGRSQLAHDLVIARLQTEIQLRDHNVSLTSEEGKAQLALAASVTLQNAKLRDVQKSFGELQSLGASVVDTIGQGLSAGTWQGWKDAGMSTLKLLQQEFIKLALLNPIKNMMNPGGEQASTLSTLFKAGLSIFSHGATGPNLGDLSYLQNL